MNPPRVLWYSLLAAGTLSVALPSAGARAGSPGAGAPPASAAPSIDWAAKNKALEAVYAEAQSATGQPPSPEALAAAVEGILADVDLASLELAQLERGWGFIVRSPALREAGLARLDVLAQATDASGAQAAMSLAQRLSSAPERQAAAAKMFFDHAAAEEYLKSRGMRARMQAAALILALNAEDRAPYVDRVVGWADVFTVEAPMSDLRSMNGFAMALRDLSQRMPEALPKAEFDAVRVRLVGVARGAAEKATSEDRPEDAKALAGIAKRLDSAAMRGELIGNAAPALTFEWIEDPGGTPQWRTLEDLKGKVVVLDFWATWCGPCVASFPNIKELRAHYSPEDLVIIGATSLQGSHFWARSEEKPDRERKVDTAGNPDLERQLMREYMAEMGLTWAVAFTAEEVFNPEYDVNGIPHLAIIDTQGRIQHNGLHPSMPMAEKTAIIDALLAERGR
ncbi:MAG TPA: TlpA disulfide reductase family protein [Phycisphaerales bacterium]|nr:TlpA disulfide reductase family protein [Phycisphaerales bacterium]HMP38669.1 TlpA disulfide reductase family protein [Phycisphaerales bacterium]